MADDNFKSLLSPQSSWYDIAKGAFNRDKKFQKRKRKAQVGLFFMDIWENNKKNKVLKNLQALEDEKVLKHAGLQADFDKSIKLIESNDAINASSNKQYTYYDDLAENWFNENYGSIDGFSEEDLYSQDFINKKRELKRNYIDGTLYQRHLDEMKGVPTITVGEGEDAREVFVRTKEAYFKPYDDYYKAKQKYYTQPKNLSVIHQALSFIPGLGGDEITLKEDINSTKELADKRIARRKDLFTDNEAQTTLAINIEDLRAESQNFTIDIESAYEILDDAGVDKNLQDNLLRDARGLSKDGNVYTVGNVNTVLTSYLDEPVSYQLTAIQEDNKDKVVAIMGPRPEVADVNNPTDEEVAAQSQYDRDFKYRIKELSANQLGMEVSYIDKLTYSVDSTVDFLYDLDPDLDPERKNELRNKFIEDRILKEFGTADNQLVNSIRTTYMAEIASEVMLAKNGIGTRDGTNDAFNFKISVVQATTQGQFEHFRNVVPEFKNLDDAQIQSNLQSGKYDDYIYNLYKLNKTNVLNQVIDSISGGSSSNFLDDFRTNADTSFRP
tara:strand:- start:2038 stop:3699 length:1662 start_codon:yes stop_codon:yes gene_type:complete